jgi:hypothetical protein
MRQPRVLPAVQLLKDGRVVILGGNAATRAVEIYDPATGQFTANGLSLTYRDAATAIRREDDRILLLSGDSRMVELYDPASGQSVQAGTIGSVRVDQPPTALSDGRVLLAGGWVSSGAIKPLTTAEILDPATGSAVSTSGLVTPRGQAATTLLPDGRVLYLGGVTLHNVVSDWLTSVEVYTP